METLQHQIDRLNQQIETLNRAIEQLTGHISSLMNDKKAASHVANGHSDLVGYPNNGFSGSHHGYHDWLADSKDILIEDDNMGSTVSVAEKTMSPELQIQRLTAQLTAAYNRIAALEEQLLARRVS
jgi:chaperonin cofactor prefoldin